MANKQFPVPDFAASLPLPSGWTEHVTPSNGRKYYVETATKTSTYDDPRFAKLPLGWEMKWDSKKNKPYFADYRTKTTTYDDPRIKKANIKNQPVNSSNMTSSGINTNTTPSYLSNSSSNVSNSNSQVPSYLQFSNQSNSSTTPSYLSNSSSTVSNSNSNSNVPAYMQFSNQSNSSPNLPSYASFTSKTNENSKPSTSIQKKQTTPIKSSNSRNTTPNRNSNSRNQNQNQNVQQTNKRIYINGKLCTAKEIQILRRAGSPCIDGNYWYDRKSGIFGLMGGALFCFFVPGLPVGGSLQSNCSNGTTGVFINGRNLCNQDVGIWYQYIGPVCCFFS